MQKIFSRLPERLRRKRAAFGIDAAIMIVFILAMMTALALAGPSLIQTFADLLVGGPKGVYALLIELPTWRPENPSAKPPAGASAARWVGYVAGNLFPLFQQVALALLAVVLIISAMCYIFETFKFMSEGTAMNIILNSVFTLIIIFAVPYLYNGVATAINAFTGWPDVGGMGRIITGDHEISVLIQAMGGAVLSGGWDLVVRFFGSVVLFIIAISVLMLAVMMGVVRLLLIGCMAAALPILLMLRLIPPVKHFADSLIETVIGIMFASIVAAVFVHFGFMLLAPVELGGAGIAGIIGTVIALATFLGAAYMSTMFAGRLGSLFTAMGGMASTASAMATGLLLGGAAMGTGTAGGAVSGVLQHGKQLAGAGASKWEVLKAGVGALGSKAGLKALGAGVGAGLGTTAAAVLPGVLTGGKPAKILQAATGAMPSVVYAAQDAIKNRTGTVAENLLYWAASEKHPMERASDGTKFLERMKGMSDEAVGAYFGNLMDLEFDNAKAGGEMRRLLEDFSDKPALADRTIRNLERFKAMSPEKRAEVIMQHALNSKKAKDNRDKITGYLGRVPYDPKLEALDWQPGFMDKIMETPKLGQIGTVAKARILNLSREGFDERLKAGALDQNVGRRFYERVIGPNSNRKSDYEVGKWASEYFGVYVPNNDRGKLEELGHGVKAMFDNMVAKDPRLLDNLERERAKAGNLSGRDPAPELSRFEENKQWYQRMWVGDIAPSHRVALTPTKPKEGESGGGSGGGETQQAPSPPPAPPPSSSSQPSAPPPKTQPSAPPAQPTKKGGRLRASIDDAAGMERILEEAKKSENQQTG